MDILIIYFSGTGNTELIAQEIGLKLEALDHRVELVSIEKKEQIESIELNDRIIGFGFPTYKLTFPDIFQSTVRFLNKRAVSNKYFMFSTYARFTSNSFRDFFCSLDKKKFSLIGMEKFKSPSCGMAARRPESDFEYKSTMFFEDDINEKLDRFVQSIIKGSVLEGKIFGRRNPLAGIKLRVVENIERTKYPRLQVDDGKCRACGLCADKCPERNLLLKNSRIIVLDDLRCLHCLRCMNHCPANAICFGKLTEGSNRYTIKKRNELFSEAKKGYKNQYWSDSAGISVAWRRKTIRYWLSHWYRPEK